MRILPALLLAACSFRPNSAEQDAAESDGALGDAPALGDRVRALEVVEGKVAGGPHADFPLLVALTAPFLADLAHGGEVVRPDGFDIYFSADRAGTARLAHEVERYDPATGALIAWVKIPSLVGSTTVFVHCGSTEITTSQQDPTAVWTGGYATVLHLDDGGDATANATQVEVQATQILDTPLDRGHLFDGKDDRVIVTSPVIDDIFATGGTAEGWFFASSYGEGGFGRLWDKGHTNGWSFALDDNVGSLAFVHGDSDNFGEWNGPLGTVSLNTWHHGAVVYDRQAPGLPLIYLDGAQLQNLGVVDAPSGTPDSDAGNQLMGGNRGAGDRTFDGQLDELRLANVVRSAGWIATQYANQSDPAGFYTLGDPL